MRWERLFADLEAEAEALETAELEADVAERTRAERSRLRLVDRLRGSTGRVVVVRVVGAEPVRGTLRGVGPDWLHVAGTDGADRVLRLGAVVEVTGLGPTSAAPGSEGRVAAAYGLPAVLRRLARDRALVTLELGDGSALTGVVEIAGADLVELTDRRPDEPGAGAAATATGRRTVPLAAVSVVRER